MERVKQLLGRQAKYERVADTEMAHAPYLVHKMPSSALVSSRSPAPASDLLLCLAMTS